MKLPPFFYEIFNPSLPRLGPGSAASTKRALDRLYQRSIPQKLRILDMGCGNGAQTIELARLTRGDILAVDNHEPYLEEVARRARAAGLAEHITVQQGDMHSPVFAPDSFDLIWFEGSMFVMGFEAGLRSYRPLLHEHGKMAISDLVWFSESPPAECKEFFAEAGAPVPAGDTVRELIAASGFVLLDSFRLPENDWRENYYAPLEARLAQLQTKAQTKADQAIMDAVAQEIELYRKHSRHYGYEFFLVEKA